jgi:hypothetical protein
MLGSQVGEAGVTANLEIRVEDDARVGQQLDPAADDVLFQLEAWNAIDQQAAHAVVTVIDMDVVALGAQFLGGGQTGGAGADDPDRLAILTGGRARLDPALLPRGVVDVFLDRTDGDGAVGRLLDHAIAFAQAILRADATADFREIVGGLADLVGLFQAAFGGQLQPIRDVVGNRAMHLAEGNAALRAAAGLFVGAFGGETGVDLVEVLATLPGGAFVGHRLRGVHEAQHLLVRHDLCSCCVAPRACGRSPDRAASGMPVRRRLG